MISGGCNETTGHIRRPRTEPKNLQDYTLTDLIIYSVKMSCHLNLILMEFSM